MIGSCNCLITGVRKMANLALSHLRLQLRHNILKAIPGLKIAADMFAICNYHFILGEKF